MKKKKLKHTKKHGKNADEQWTYEKNIIWEERMILFGGMENKLHTFNMFIMNLKKKTSTMQ